MIDLDQAKLHTHQLLLKLNDLALEDRYTYGGYLQLALETFGKCFLSVYTAQGDTTLVERTQAAELALAGVIKEIRVTQDHSWQNEDFVNQYRDRFLVIYEVMLAVQQTMAIHVEGMNGAIQEARREPKRKP